MNKRKELSILKKIYNLSKIKYEVFEKPDFILKNYKTNFGVEICELYLNNTIARVINYDGYLEKILNSNDTSILDKNDIGNIKKSKLYIWNEEIRKYCFLIDVISVKNDYNLDFHSEPSYELVEKKVIDIINKKHKKSLFYIPLEYYELIIQSMQVLPEKYIERLCKSDRIIEAIRNSRFKRMYLLINNCLCVYGENIVENIKFSIIGGASSEQCN